MATARAFRQLLKTERKTFNADLPQRIAAQKYTKDQFLNNKDVSDPVIIDRMIKEAYLADEIIKKHVVQGVLKDSSNGEPVYELKITEETEKGKNDDRFIVPPKGKRSSQPHSKCS
ncbi:hypothetical protein HK098_001924 [Nowakowskiella sp. JEL0407]|nr:hypothetical protein HK098_001924 [Nowakowskiella sp. JEL0407]